MENMLVVAGETHYLSSIRRVDALVADSTVESFTLLEHERTEGELANANSYPVVLARERLHPLDVVIGANQDNHVTN